MIMRIKQINETKTLSTGNVVVYGHTPSRDKPFPYRTVSFREQYPDPGSTYVNPADTAIATYVRLRTYVRALSPLQRFTTCYGSLLYVFVALRIASCFVCLVSNNGALYLPHTALAVRSWEGATTHL